MQRRHGPAAVWGTATPSGENPPTGFDREGRRWRPARRRKHAPSQNTRLRNQSQVPLEEKEAPMRPSRAIVATLALLAVAAPAVRRHADDPRGDRHARARPAGHERLRPLVRRHRRRSARAHAAHRARPDRRARRAPRRARSTVQFFASFNSGLLQRFGSGQSATGGWQFTVNGVPSQVGADTRRRAERRRGRVVADRRLRQAGLVPAARPRPRRRRRRTATCASASPSSTPPAAR